MGTDHHPNHTRLAPHGELQEVMRLAAAGRIAVAQHLVRLYDEVLDEPLPEELAALVKRLEVREAKQR